MKRFSMIIISVMLLFSLAAAVCESLGTVLLTH